MRATLFRNLTADTTEIEICAGRCIRKSLPEVDFERALVFANNALVPPEYVPREGDRVLIRLIPGAVTTALVLGGAALLLGGSIYCGYKFYQMHKAAQRQQDEIDRMKRMSNKNDIDNRPFLRGASNTLATGNSQPYVIGRHFFAPYLLCPPFYTLSGADGKDMKIHLALECGFSAQVLRKITIDDIQIKAFPDDSPQQGAFAIDSGVFAEGGRIEIVQDGGNFSELPLNEKVTSVSCNDEIPYFSEISGDGKPYLAYTLDKYAMDVTFAITFPNGLYHMGDSGKKEELSARVDVDFSLDGGRSWQSIFDGREWGSGGDMSVSEGDRPEVFQFRRCEAKREIRFSARREFTARDYAILRANGQECISIRAANFSKRDTTNVNACYCLFYQSRGFDPEKGIEGGELRHLVPCKLVEDRERKFCTILGLSLLATANNEDKLKKIGIVTQGVARVWDGHGWSADRRPTRNPAAWALEVLTSGSHPASRYDDDEIDLGSFGEFYDYCENPDGSGAAEHFSYRIDMVVTQKTKKREILDRILESANAVLYQDLTGRLAVAVDRRQENALSVYNPQNIISISNRRSFGRKSDGLRVKYVDSQGDLYRENTYLVMRDGRKLDENSLIRDITLTGITEHEQVVRYARRVMAVETLRPKTTTIRVGNEGVFYTPFSKVLIQDDSLRKGIGSGYTVRECRWYGGLLKSIRIDGRVTFDPRKRYGIIVNCFTANGAVPVPIKVRGNGTTDILEAVSDVREGDADIARGNVLSFGELDANGEFSRVTSEFLISSIRRSDSGFELELVNYDEAIYDSGEIPPYASNMTQTRSSAFKEIPSETITRNEISDMIERATAEIDPGGEIAAREAAQEAADVVSRGIRFTSMHRIHEAEVTLEELLERLDMDADNAASGLSVTEDAITMRIADTERELLSLISVNKAGITALVRGAGTEGRLSLSLELPVLLDAKGYAQLSGKCGKALSEKVYAMDADSGFYVIRGDAGDSDIKSLWDAAVRGKALASQIVIDADQTNVNGTAIFTAGRTAQNLGYKSPGDMMAAARRGETIIDGGKIRTKLIEVEKLLAQNIALREGGIIHSRNWNGTQYDGRIPDGAENWGSVGWAIDYDGRAIFNGINIRGEATFFGKSVETTGHLRLPCVKHLPEATGDGYVYLCLGG